MSISADKIVKIIECNELNNVICRPLELRPEEIAKYICGLSNKEGGFVFIGIEKRNGQMVKIGCFPSFEVNTVVNNAVKMITGEPRIEFDFVNVSGTNVFVIAVIPVEQKIFLAGKYYEYDKNSVCEMALKEKEDPITLFISYTECDAPIVDVIENRIKEKIKNDIKISRYTEVKYKENFKTFMNTIQEHDFVLTVVSDTYLKRQACMYEVGEIIKDHHYKDKLLFIVLSENERRYYEGNAPEKIGPDIYNGAEKRLEYISFWQQKYNSLRSKMKEIADYEAISKATEDLKILGQIYRKDMGEFLDFLADENGKNFESLYVSDFEEIIKWIS